MKYLVFALVLGGCAQQVAADFWDAPPNSRFGVCEAPTPREARITARAWM